MKTKFNFRKWLRSRNGVISIISMLLTLIIVVVIFGGDLIGLTGTAGVPVDLPAGANCLPTCDVTDGRMFTIASDGMQTLAGQSVFIKIAAPQSVASFDLSIFDGDTSATWDQGSTPLTFTLLADPTSSQVGTEQVQQWDGSSMADNVWTDLIIDQDPRAQSLGGDYFYLLRVDLPNANTTTKIASSFKIRSTSPIELATNQSFAYMVPLSTTNLKIIYPTHPDLTTTTYDGTWDMYLNVPTSQETFAIYDGDFDYGSFDCSLNDTDDPNTPNDASFSWVVPGSNLLEAIASEGGPCRDQAGQSITGVDGQVSTTSNPADDNRGPSYRRVPAVTYDVSAPDGKVYHNDNPSGNREWEQFLISSDRSVAADYYVDAPLPAGTYKIHVTGLDLQNLNAWHLTYDAVCVYADGTPCVLVLRPYRIGDTVWVDTNGNGVQDEGEAGIPGVTVTLLDAAGKPLPNSTATTDTNGKYYFKVYAGTYTVQVDAANFEAEGALAGYVSTTGGESQTNTVTNANVLTYDFGYGLPPANASIGDLVWADANGNGIQDDGEAGIAGVTVNLLGSDGATVFATTMTDANGNYNFADLAAGTYYVQVVAPDAKAFTVADTGDDAADSDVDASGKTAAITLSAGETNTSVDAGLKDVVSCATNNLVLNPSFEENKGSPPKKWTNGTAGTIGIPVPDGKYAGYVTSSKVMSQSVNVGVGNSYTLTFYSGSHNPSKQTVKLQYFNKKGAAIGTGATHTITSDLENTGFGGPYTLTLDPAPSDATSLKIMVSANNKDYAKVDKLCLLAETPPATASIGDFVWNDMNRNGIQDAGEAGMEGVTVNLLGGDGTSVIASTVTDAAGMYSFTELLPGTYIVQVVAPAETSFTKANAGDDGKDSDVDATSGKTAAITLNIGEANTSVDAGLKQSLSLSCPGNLVLNPSFEENSGTPPKSWTNGTAGNVGVWVDGKNVGYISGSKMMSQSVSVNVGSSYKLTFYSGSHNPSIQTVKLQYFNAGGTAIGTEAKHTIVDDLEVVGFGGPYSLTLDAAPSDAASLKIMVSANNKDYAKVDALCLQATEPVVVEPTPEVPACTAGNTYNVENTTNNPFYSVKFEFASGAEVKSGSYDVFKYTLPADVVASMTSMQIEAKASTDSRTYNLACDFTSPAGCAAVGDDAYSVQFVGATDNGDGTYTLKFKVYVYGSHGLSHVSFGLPEGQVAGGITGSYTTESCE